MVESNKLSDIQIISYSVDCRQTELYMQLTLNKDIFHEHELLNYSHSNVNDIMKNKSAPFSGPG